MNTLSRRDLMKITLAAGAAPFVRSSVLGANEEIRVAVIGIRSKGAQHIDVFQSVKGVRVAALCDVDQEILDLQIKKYSDKYGQKVVGFRDMRKILDDKTIDAVAIAAPNHWHSLAAIWACQAGKDVYVEKPISHSPWEGSRLVEAARKYKRIVQAGTQNRSDVGFREAVAYIKEGKLGKIQWAHGLWYKERESIGRITSPQPVPATIDYDLWTGPAPLEPLMRKSVHYDWHWFWATGNGDLANLGAHQIDDCRFALGVSDYPTRVISYGGRFTFDDNAQTPNTQVAIYDFPNMPVLIEIRNLPRSKGVRAMDHVRGVREGNIIQCEGGYFAGGRGGGWVYDNNGKKVKNFPGDGGGLHQENFIKAVRSRRSEELHADILEGHKSANLCHMANISYRLGKICNLKDLQPQTDHLLIKETLERIKQHLAANEVDLGKEPAQCGPWLEIDGANERFKGQGVEAANALLKREVYRKPFSVPEKV